MLEYSEKLDFEEKVHVLEQMLERIERHGMQRDLHGVLALEVGGSGGIFGGLLSKIFKRIVVSDITDTQVQYKGEFARLLKEKFERNGHDFSFEKIEFQVADAMDLPYRDQYFDVVVSLNAFEHIPKPLVALREVLRVTKEGGLVYLTFDPVWTADNGNHFHHFVPEPWAHLLYSTEEFSRRMISAGAGENLTHEFRVGMNRQPASVYKSEFPAELRKLGASQVYMEEWRGCVQEGNVNHPNRFDAAKKLGCPADDLLIRGFAFCVIK
jgi:ubiquinone/menaquinone biosynthesis C-methylase UbiE